MLAAKEEIERIFSGSCLSFKRFDLVFGGELEKDEAMKKEDQIGDCYLSLPNTTPKMDQPPTSLFKLPIDVLESILRQLSNQSLSSIRTSCSGGKLLVDDELLWKQKVEGEYLRLYSNWTRKVA